jgi:hypothetical protein
VITVINANYAKVPAIWPTGVINDALAAIYDSSLIPINAPPFFDENYVPDPALLPPLAGTYEDPLGFKGSGPQTLQVFVDPADSGKLAGSWSDSNGSTDVTFEGFMCADGFNTTKGSTGYHIRFWRDAAGNGSAVELFGDKGPPFFRTP